MYRSKISAQSFLLCFVYFICCWKSVNAGGLRTSGRWIVNGSNQRIKLRCVNWAGHGETRVPEGLQYQSIDYIASWLSSNGFNCVRLTYSIDMALNPNQKVSDAFTASASAGGVSSSAMQTAYNQAVAKNSFLSSASVLDTFARVIDSLGSKGVYTILDNHVSRASWCCGGSDGNGWPSTGSGYTAANSRYFNTNNWLSGLRAMATFAKSHSSVVGMSLRNELRPTGSQNQNNNDWYTFINQAADAVYGVNNDVLIIIGGTNYATDLSYIYSRPLDFSRWPNRVVWEWHAYSWSGSASTCSQSRTLWSNKVGYLLVEGKSYTAPLFLSEFGWDQTSGTDGGVPEYSNCLVAYLQENDSEWAVWALQGSYYIREGNTDVDESFGILNKNWSGWRNSAFKNTIAGILKVSQGPSAPSTTTTTTTTTSRTTTATTSSRTSTTTTSSRTSSTTASGGGCTSAQWAQCGGVGFTGCTACAGTLKCIKLNDYYFQCQ